MLKNPARMVESCPDGDKDGNPLKGILRILALFFWLTYVWPSMAFGWCSQGIVLDPYLASLLLVETCNVAAFLTFWSNISYLTEGTYGYSSTACSLFMLGYSLCNALGLFFSDENDFSRTKTLNLLYSCSGLLLFMVGSFFSQFFWAYLLWSFLQALFGLPASCLRHWSVKVRNTRNIKLSDTTKPQYYSFLSDFQLIFSTWVSVQTLFKPNFTKRETAVFVFIPTGFFRHFF